MNAKAVAVALASSLAAVALVAALRSRDVDSTRDRMPRTDATSNGRQRPAPAVSAVGISSDPDLRLVFVTDLEGELEPCGCTQDQRGGIDRLAAAIVTARARGGPTFVIAAGNLFLPNPRKALPPATAQQNWAMEALADVLRQLPLSAAGVGSADLTLGHARLAELGERAGTKWLAAGVGLEPVNRALSAQEMATTPADPLVASQLIRAGSLRLGVLGLVERASAQAGAEDARPWYDRARSLRAAGANLVVALVHGSRASAERLANSAQPDVVVLTGPESAGHDARQVGASILLSGGKRGEDLTTLELFSAAKDRPWELRSAERGERCEAGAARACALESSQPMSTDLAPAAGVRAALDRLTLRVKEHNRVAYADTLPVPVASGKAGYVGSRPCAACHTAEYLWWQSSRHGNAFASLQKRNKELDLDCVGCHVTGYGKPGGSTVTHTEHLQNVGCESCHGPGSLHIVDARPSQKTMPPAVAKATCTSCHDRSHSEAFDEALYRSLLKKSGHD